MILPIHCYLPKGFWEAERFVLWGFASGRRAIHLCYSLEAKAKWFFFYLFFSSSFCLSLLTCERQSCQIVLARVGADYVYNRSLPRSLQNRLLPFSLEKAAVTQEASHLHCAWMLWFRSFFFFTELSWSDRAVALVSSCLSHCFIVPILSLGTPCDTCSTCAAVKLSVHDQQ